MNPFSCNFPRASNLVHVLENFRNLEITIAMKTKDEKVELIEEAIRRLLEKERRTSGASSDDEEDGKLHLSRLRSQLESLKGNLEGGESEAKDKEIVKELKNLKRQNSITHWLLAAMIVLTIARQASEVTMLLKVKDGLSNPFKCFGGMISSIFSSRGSDQTGPDEKRNGESFPAALRVPEIPSAEDIGITGGKQ